MKLTIQSILLVAILAAASSTEAATQSSWFGRKDPSYYDWTKDKLEGWLNDHKINYAQTSNQDQLRDLVQQNYDKAYDTWSDSDVSSWLAERGLVPSPSVSPRKRVINTIRRSYDDAYEYWSTTDLTEWLEDHNLKPSPKSTREELVDQVKSNYHSAQSYLAPPSTSQKFFNNAKAASDKVVDSWTDSEVRSYLLEQGVISPSGTREELVVLAKQKYNEAAKTASDAAGKVGEKAEEAWLTAVDAPKKAYDFVAEKGTEASDYVWSSWTDSQLREYLIDQGVIKSTSQAKRDELVGLVKDNYNSAANNVYDTWSDSYLRKWLINHGVVQSKSAKTRDELLDLASKNYYGARDTTYAYWNDNQIRHWLESRGIIQPGAKTQAEQLKKLIEENYYSGRDQVYNTWDDNQLRHWLEKRGYIKTPTEAKRDELIASVKDNFYTANDQIWDTWSDSTAREWLVKNNVIDDKTALEARRDQLEKYLSESWVSAKENVNAGWKESDVREWLMDNGYLKSDSQVRREEALKSFQENYKIAASKTNEYVSWSDNRIRGWLRTHGVEVPMKSDREELLQIMKDNYVATQSTLGGIFNSASEAAAAALEKLKGAVGVGQGYGEEAGLKAKARQANKAFEETQKEAKKKAAGLKEEL